MADTATRLHRECGFADAVEDGPEVIADAAQYETVEQSDVAVGFSAR